MGCGRNRYWALHVFRGFGLLRRKLLIQSVPSSTVRSAALGLVEVSGTATGPYSIISPLSETECYFYRAILPRHPPLTKLTS